METRTDRQRDECIDKLLGKVQELEREVVSLKAEMSVRTPDVPARKTDTTPSSIPVNPEPQPSPGSGIPSARPGKYSIENVIGTRWIGRIGMVAVILGIGFFLKYSFDSNLIGEAGRIILGIIVASAFLGGGEYLQKKKNLGLYGQMISGGGLALFYLSLYAAYAFYHLIPMPLATAGMIAVTTTGITLSVRYSAVSLSGISLLGGFLTPLLLSSAENQPLLLFIYILLLDAGILLLQRFRRWPSLVLFSLVGTALLYFSWHDAFYTDEQQWSALGAVAVFYLCFNLHALLSGRKPESDASKADRFVIFVAAAFFLLAFLAQQHWVYTWPVKIFALLLSGVETGFAELAVSRLKTARITAVSYAAVSVIMTVTATFIVFDQHWVLPALAIEMAVLGWCWFRLDLPEFRWGVYLLALVVLQGFAVNLVYFPEPFEHFLPLFNSRFLVCSVTVAAFYVLLYTISRYRDTLDANERAVSMIIFFITQALSLILLSFEVHDVFMLASQEAGYWVYARELSLSVLWALYASVLTGAGIYRRIRRARLLGILLLGVTVLKVFFLDLSSLETIYRIVSFIVLGLLLLAVSYAYNRFKHIIFGEDQP
ncbi:MAG: DUF2339 domain-containing protein [Chlorobiaceae bacterium]|nr:DUF2339 domain-containing protein [Chlorobiaceae bacterium]NTV59809.1 DUF2339 domain-containing protein [Chlorobiaceae bacterium]